MLSLDEIEKFSWQILIGALIIDFPFAILTTSSSKIIWIIIYILIVFIVIISFSIIKHLSYRKESLLKRQIYKV